MSSGPRIQKTLAQHEIRVRFRMDSPTGLEIWLKK